MAISALHFSGVKVEQLGHLKVVTGVYQPGASGAAGGTHSYTSGGEIVTQAILKAFSGLLEVRFWNFAKLMKSDFSTATNISFDHARTAAQVGVIHIFQAHAAHTHDILAIGGLTSSETLFLDASQSFGKNAATNRTIVGATSATTGGVVAAAVQKDAAEVASTTAYTNYTARFMILGR